MDKVSLFHLTILYLLLVIVSILFGLDDDSVKKFNLNGSSRLSVGQFISP